MLKAIVFDFDGVIVDSEPLHYRAFLKVAETVGVRFSYEEYLEKYIGYDDRDAFRVMLGLPPSPGSEANEKRVAALVARKADTFEEVVHEGIEPIAGVVDFIRAASSIPIAIASGATSRDIQLILKKLDLHAHFTAIVTADMVKRSKPDPQSYAMAAEALAMKHAALKIHPGECLAIEDTAAGVQSASGAGLMTLGLTTTGTAEKLHKANRVIADFRGLTLEKLRTWYG